MIASFRVPSYSDVKGDRLSGGTSKFRRLPMILQYENFSDLRSKKVPARFGASQDGEQIESTGGSGQAIKIQKCALALHTGPYFQSSLLDDSPIDYPFATCFAHPS